MSQFVFPTNATLSTIEQEKMPRMMADRACFNFATFEDAESHLVLWEQRDSAAGLQQLRGLGGKPSRVRKLGSRRFSMEAGVYGEYQEVDEIEMTTRRQFGTPMAPIDITDLVMQDSEFLNQRYFDCVESVIWATFNGSISVLGQGGQIAYQDTFAVQSYTAGVQWLNPTTSGPLQNFRDVQLFSRGRSIDLGAAAEAYMNRRTFNYLIANTNPADLYGKRTQGLATIMNLDQVNAVLAGEGLPTIIVYDEGYLMDPGFRNRIVPGPSGFSPYIPDNTVYVVGKRPANAPVIRYKLTRNANNPGMAPGQYFKVIDKTDLDVPAVIETHNGHNGGPAVYYASAMVKMAV